ncbi:MAG: KEOPS complex subunit Pcc1 [Candidatus Methanomethyliaceae archaeon]|nr:KEOPS complex subunit Pcc1 [Candidatus Methanomethyliaceae archaeon]MCX8169554.1 KEOPS complex subunit Pcc1 [Candidatus Methanomethyliaceae archaeon]MDW7970694.1 KEOPS complex subunit Pcc1 [Nitrososphaerota archaeon]
MKDEKFPISSTLVIETTSEKIADSLYKVLVPEVRTTKSKSTRISIRREGQNLYLYIRAKTMPGLRAILNSYLRWINSSLEILLMNSKTNKS